MRDYKRLSLVLIICGGLTLIYAEQRKPNKPTQLPQTQQPQARISPEQNKVPVRQLYEEMFTRGRYELQGAVFANGCPVHFGNRTVGLQEAVAEGKGWRSASPDLVMAINNISANGDMVTVSWTGRGTHTGQGHGLKPTGKKFQLQGRSQFRVVNGKIVEAWNEEYRPELFRQLGITKTQALMFFAGEKLLAAADPFIPNRFYDAVQ